MSRLADKPIMNAFILEKHLQEQHDPIYQKIADRTKDIDCKQFIELVDCINPHPTPKENYSHVASIVPRRARKYH